jgi:hypothetical protein
MDYSLLVGIHDCEKAQEEAKVADAAAATTAAGGKQPTSAHTKIEPEYVLL